MKKADRVLPLVLAMALLPVSCAYYSFSGATIPGHLSTIAIPLADDNSLSTVTGLDERITSFLIDRFVGQTRLSLTTDPQEADAVLTVAIDRYQNQPTSVGGDERASLNRVNITVNVQYYDAVRDEELISRTFSSFEEYEALNPSLEGDAAIAALEKVADDIFTAATSNW